MEKIIRAKKSAYDEWMGAQSSAISIVWIAVVWVPKKRRKVLLGSLKKEVETILGKLCQYKGVEVIQGSICPDHVHLCLSIAPKYSVSSIVGYLKGKSTMILFEKYSPYRKNYKGHTF